MTSDLIFSVVLIGLALVLYSIGVWSERIAGRLKPWHLMFFWLGLICDSSGTGIMFDISGGLALNIHGITGIIAILLMLLHAVWATIVLVLKNEKAIVKFHYFSVFVWIIWLIPFFNGFFAGMRV